MWHAVWGQLIPLQKDVDDWDIDKEHKNLVS